MKLRTWLNAMLWLVVGIFERVLHKNANVNLLLRGVHDNTYIFEIYRSETISSFLTPPKIWFLKKKYI